MMIPHGLNVKNAILVEECNGWVEFSIHFLNQSDVDIVFSRIPKSYRMRIQNLYHGDGTSERLITARIVLTATELTGSKNETGIQRIIKIKNKLRELLPHFRVYTTILAPVEGHRDSYRFDRTIEGWI